ncbi:MAG: GAF domain-containing protein [Nocardioidaceae bacterium]
MEEDRPLERHELDDALGFTSLARVRLDTLLEELHGRVGDVLASQDRLRSLLDAVVDLGTDLDLPRVLQRITDAACTLANARYGALGVLGPDGEVLAEFITHGVTDEERARIGPPPSGHGVLGVLIKEPQPIRLPHIGDHPQSYGFPSNHPPMESFLGVPVRVHDHVYGNLYLTEKIGADEFTDLDERIMVALAAAAGVAIDNARLYELTDRRRQWLQATAEIMNVLLGEVDRAQALRLIAGKAREVSGCDVAAVLLADQSDDGRHLVLEVVEGIDAGSIEGERISIDAGGVLAEAMEQESPVIVDDLAKEAQSGRAQLPAEFADMAYAVLVPLRTPAGGGVLLAAQRRDASQLVAGFDIELIGTFANQTALALERVRAQEDRAQVAVLEDRDRIARDLHDLVIQRLFASGLQVQGALELIRRPDVRQRLTKVTDDLDSTIRDIRATIFELQHRSDRSDVRADIRGLAKEYTASFGFAPTVDLLGPVDSAVPTELRPEALAVVREGLSNAARHAQASEVHVEVDVRGGNLGITIADDGVGIGETTRRSGLRNLRERAEAHDGTLDVQPNEPHGTILRWSAPLGGDD